MDADALTKLIDGKEKELADAETKFGEEVEKLFQEEAAHLGWIMGMSDQEAEAKFGPNLHAAGLLVVEEKDKIRVVHDGTHGVKVNNRIRVQEESFGRFG